MQRPAGKELGARLFAEHPLADRDAWLATVLELWRSAGYREERYLALDLTAYRPYARWHRPDLLPLWEELIVTGAWWDFVDEVANRRIGPLVRGFPGELVTVMRLWSKDPDRWN